MCNESQDDLRWSKGLEPHLGCVIHRYIICVPTNSPLEKWGWGARDMAPFHLTALTSNRLEDCDGS